MIQVVDKGANTTIPYDQGIRPYHSVIARLVAKYVQPGQRRVLDIGCGVGNTLVEIRKVKPDLDIVIADVDPRCLAVTQEKVDVHQAVLFATHEDVYEMTDTFDVILLSHMLQYDPEPYRKVRKLVDMLNPGGYLIMASPNPSTPTKILHNLLRRYYSEGIYTWDRSVLKNFLGSFEGTRIVEVTEDYLPLPLVNTNRAMQAPLRFLGRLFPWLAFSIIVVVRKDP